jgi:hypothetical protein
MWSLMLIEKKTRCCLAISMMVIYISTPTMMAFGLWSCQEIDRINASLFSKIKSVGYDIKN